MREIVTEIHIQAAADTVWSILTDFGSYQDWNPFIQQAKGEAIVGQRLENRPKVSKGRGVVFRPVVTKVVSGRELRWYGHLLIPGLSDGEHIFEIEPSRRKGVRLVHRQIFKGLLVPILWPLMGGKTRSGFIRMNEALKTKSEEVQAASDLERQV